jgi:hypothetical protein
VLDTLCSVTRGEEAVEAVEGLDLHEAANVATA